MNKITLHLLLFLGLYGCFENLQQGKNDRAATAAGSGPSSSPLPGTGAAHWSCGAPKDTINTSVLHAYRKYIGEDSNTYSATEAWSLEMSLVFLNSLHRVTRATQNGWLRKQRAWKSLSTKKSAKCLFHKGLKQVSLLLCGEDFKEAISKYEIKHLDKRNRYSRKAKQRLSNAYGRVEWKTKTVCGCTCHCADCLSRCSATCLKTASGLHRHSGSASGGRTGTERRSAPARKQQTCHLCFSVFTIHSVTGSTPQMMPEEIVYPNPDLGFPFPEACLLDSSWKVLFLSGLWCENGNPAPRVNASYFSAYKV